MRRRLQSKVVDEGVPVLGNRDAEGFGGTGYRLLPTIILDALVEEDTGVAAVEVLREAVLFLG